MTELEQYRQEIDRIDGELVRLFLEMVLTHLHSLAASYSSSPCPLLLKSHQYGQRFPWPHVSDINSTLRLIF